MFSNYIKIESVSDEAQDKVKQTLKFPTGDFVWRVKFSAPLNPATVNNRNLYVTSLIFEKSGSNSIPLIVV